MPMRYRTILFDAGDTLLRVPNPAPTYQRILADCGSALDLAGVERILADTRQIVDERIPGWVGEDLTLDRKASARRRALHVDTFLSLAGVSHPQTARQVFFDLYVGTGFFTLYPDVVGTLQQLRWNGYQLGVVSNWESRLRQLFAAHGIDEYFDFAVVSEVEGYLKPHPELYRRALQYAGSPPDRVLHVGDKLREDVEGAAQVGIRAVLIDRENGSAIDYRPRISTLSDLPGLLVQGMT